jgi:TM2 domain-containing membrane protein YozV
VDKFYLQLNAVNIITVTLMWLIGFALIGFISAYIRNGMDGEGS